PAVEDTVFGALAKDPTQRFVTVEDFASALEEACFATQLLPISPPIKADSSEHDVQSGTFLVQQPTPSTLSPVAPAQIISQLPLPVSVVSTSAPPDQSYLELWEAHLRPLEQAGLLTVWSDHNISPGASRQQQIDQHLDQADLIVLLVSADFFSSDDC